MNFNVKQSEILKGLQAILSIIPSKSTLPILSNAAFQNGENELSISATDLDVSIITHIPVRTKTEGEITLPAKKVAEVIRELPDKTLEFNLEKEQMRITSPLGTYKILGFRKDEFPDIPQNIEGTEIKVDGSLLHRMIEKSVFAYSTDETRPALNGVLWHIKKDEMRMVATDGHRLAKIVNTEKIKRETEKEVIIPAKALNCLNRFRSEEDELEKIIIGDNHVLFELGRTRIFSRLIAETYPNYERVIPSDNDKILKVNRDILSSSVKRVSILSNAITHQVKFSLNKDKIILSALDQEIGGEANEEIDAEYNGEPMDVGYNAQYLLEILSHIESEEVKFELSTPTTAGIIYPSEQKEHEDYLCLIMPLRLN
ncbi:MAG: DNA polymerase III subunit beta [Gemmatimonadota bacterium]|nr:MAG: DNA polymerase III subunit beta [Gemmatimonadota bacterium]